MKNTKLTFYCTHFQYGKLEKVIFEIIISNMSFKSLKEAKQWLNEPTIESIYRQFYFDCVFDWVILNYSSTNEDASGLKILQTIEGKFSFPKTKVKPIKTNEQEVFVPKSQYYLTEEEVAERERIRAGKKKDEPVKTYKSVWIDPYGKTYNVGFADHDNFASEWLHKNDRKSYEDTKKAFNKYYYETLEEKGWIRILGWTDPPTFCLPDNIGPRLKQSLREYCVSNTVSYHSWPDILKS